MFLTLFPDQAPESGLFTCVRYSSLLRDRPSFDKGSALALQLSSAWLDVLEHFYDSEHLDADEQVAQKLSDAQAPDAGYVAFCTLIRSISFPPDVALDHLYRQSQKGRRYCGAAATKPRWKTEPFDDSGRRWTLPKDNRRIHVEPQCNFLNCSGRQRAAAGSHRGRNAEHRPGAGRGGGRLARSQKRVHT